MARQEAGHKDWERLTEERAGCDACDAMVMRFDEPDWHPWQA